MVKVIVFGAGGQLGYDIVRHLERKGRFTVYGFRHEELDITSFDRVKDVIFSLRPDIVFNCAAWNRVDDAELPENSYEVFKTNAFAPAVMAEVSSKVGATFVTVSTDYVFDGKKGEPYDESDGVNPLSVYALSKLLGELLVRRCSERHIIVRSGGLYGIMGSPLAGRAYRNFVERVIENVSGRRLMRVVCDVFSAPTYTFELARKMCEVVEEGFFGLIHIMQKGAISWYDFSRTICRLVGLDDRYIQPVSQDELRALAKRPRFSVLKNSLLERAGRNDLMEVEEALRTYLEERGLR